MPITQVKGTDIETSSFETKVETAVTSGAAGDDVQAALPIGTVLMYNGTGIADVATRTEDIGDRMGDTITLSGWKVCNGNASTPNLLNKFIRSEAASGNTGGNDSASHSHGLPSHSHNQGSLAAAIGACNNDTSTLGYIAAVAGGQQNPTYIVKGSNVSFSNWNHYTKVYGTTGSSTLSTNSQTGGTDNKPAYYSLIFIIKIS